MLNYPASSRAGKICVFCTVVHNCGRDSVTLAPDKVWRTGANESTEITFSPAL